MRFPAIALLTSLVVLVGCGDDTTDAGSDASFVTAKSGYHKIRKTDDGYVYSGVAVSGSKAYLAKGARGVHEVDLGTMKVTQKIERDAADAQLFVDGVVTAGKELLAYGQRDDAEPDPYAGGEFARSFVMTFIDRSSRKSTQTVRIDLTRVLSEGSSGFVDLPNMAASYDPSTDRLAVTFGHMDLPERLFVFARPTEDDVSFDLEEIPGADVWEVDNPHAVFLTGDLAYLAASSDGAFVLDMAAAEITHLSADVGYAVGITAAGGSVFVADHDSGLHVLDATSGEIKADVAVDDWVTGVAVDKSNVYVGSWNGLYVARNQWK